MHRARWMSKAIYGIKMFLVRDQLPLDPETLAQLERFCIYVVLFYVPYCFQAKQSTSAPRIDLELLLELDQYFDVDPEAAEAAYAKMLRHLWYLGDELVCLSLFDENLSAETKYRIIKNMKKPDDTVRQLKANIQDTFSIQELSLEHFVSIKSINFFKILEIDTTFLDKEGYEIEDPNFIKAGEISRNLRTTNDTSERSLAVMTKYNGVLTVSEEETQGLLQIVTNRKRVSSKKL